MKIDYALMASNNDPLYLDFWPIVSKLWKEKFNITPVLYYIDDNHNVEIDETYGEVIKLKPIPKIPVYLQCLWVRYWGFVNYPNDVCIISDIDMLPLSKEYFIDSISNIDDDKYVHLNPCFKSYGTLPSCYHICRGSKFKEILELHDNWEDSITFLNNLDLGRNPGNGNNKWFSDEEYSSNKIFDYKTNKPDEVIFLDRDGGQNGRRIDRSDWAYNIEYVKNNYYYDSHSIRPYHMFKDEIDKLVDLV